MYVSVRICACAEDVWMSVILMHPSSRKAWKFCLHFIFWASFSLVPRGRFVYPNRIQDQELHGPDGVYDFAKHMMVFHTNNLSGSKTFFIRFDCFIGVALIDCEILGKCFKSCKKRLRKLFETRIFPMASFKVETMIDWLTPVFPRFPPLRSLPFPRLFLPSFGPSTSDELPHELFHTWWLPASHYNGQFFNLPTLSLSLSLSLSLFSFGIVTDRYWVKSGEGGGGGKLMNC